MAEERGEKTHPATPRRRRRARERGQVAKSAEVNSLLILIGGVFLLHFLGYSMINKLFCFSRIIWSNLSFFTFNPTDIHLKLQQLIFQIAFLLLPFLLGIMIIALIANLAQVGFIFSPHPLTPDLDRINPVSGLKRIFSTEGLVRLLISILKIAIICYLSYLIIRKQLPVIFSLIGQDTGKTFSVATGLIFQLLLYLCIGMAPLAFMDYFFQKRRYEHQLMMSREELKEEYKQTEGNPLVRSRIRSMQRNIARLRMMQKVPRADVVITNPTHIAVAIEYDREKMNAPTVIAKGKGVIAEKIMEIARKNNIPLVENRWLAQMLYRLVEVGEEIPVKLYQAVAEVLAYIYRLKGKVV